VRQVERADQCAADAFEPEDRITRETCKVQILTASKCHADRCVEPEGSRGDNETERRTRLAIKPTDRVTEYIADVQVPVRSEPEPERRVQPTTARSDERLDVAVRPDAQHPSIGVRVRIEAGAVQTAVWPARHTLDLAPALARRRDPDIGSGPRLELVDLPIRGWRRVVRRQEKTLDWSRSDACIDPDAPVAFAETLHPDGVIKSLSGHDA